MIVVAVVMLVALNDIMIQMVIMMILITIIML